MKRTGEKIKSWYKLFKTKVLLSFLSFGAVIFIWVVAYGLIQEKQMKMKSFEHSLNSVQNRFLDNLRNLEHFVLVGYHTPDFYIAGHQQDIDRFILQQKEQIITLIALKSEASNRKVHISKRIDTLITLNSQLLDSVVLLRNIYYQKGFHNYGAEGEMWRSAHILEDRGLINRADLLQLRRREKDFLLRGETRYVTEHDSLSTAILNTKAPNSPASIVLKLYTKYFDTVVALTKRLSIANQGGLYAHVQQSIDEIQGQFRLSKAETDAEVTEIVTIYHNFLIVVSLFLILVAVLISVYRSNFLTRDIEWLNSNISAFVKSGFRRDLEGKVVSVSPITEIKELSNNYEQLKRVLQHNLQNLENLVKEEKRNSEYKSSFVANISHEIRTPLTGVIGMIHLMRGTHLSAEQTDLLDTLDFSASHLASLINMVLDYSKIEAGKMELESIPFDLQGDITKIVKLFDYKVREKGLKLELVFEFESDHFLIGDPLRLQQVLLNLLNNAIKFTTNGTITIRVLTVSKQETFKQVCFQVEDTGIGIEAEEISKLFQAFQQANSTISRRYGGTGLGLTISNQLIQLMGGELSVKSEVNKGTLFSFTLDFPTGETIRLKKSDLVITHAFPTGLRILLAEDNPINQKVMLRMLVKFHAQVTTVNNGREAVEAYQDADYDIIFMDIQMPEMDGLEAAKLITKSPKYLTVHTPIIAFSANAYNEDRRQAQDAGMDDFLSKPVKPEELDGIIAKYIRQDLQILN